MQKFIVDYLTGFAITFVATGAVVAVGWAVVVYRRHVKSRFK